MTDLPETQKLFFHRSCAVGVQELGEFYTGFGEEWDCEVLFNPAQSGCGD